MGTLTFDMPAPLKRGIEAGQPTSSSCRYHRGVHRRKASYQDGFGVRGLRLEKLGADVERVFRHLSGVRRIGVVVLFHESLEFLR